MKYDLAKLMHKNLSDIKKISSDIRDKVRQEYRERSEKLNERKRFYDMSGDSFRPPIYEDDDNDDEYIEKIKGLVGSGNENQAISLSESMGIDPLSKDVEIFDDHLAKIEEDIRSSKNKIKDIGFKAPRPYRHRTDEHSLNESYQPNDKDVKHIELILENKLGVSANVTNLDLTWLGTWEADVSLKFPLHSGLYSGTAELGTDGRIDLDVSNSSSNMESKIYAIIGSGSSTAWARVTVGSMNKKLNREFREIMDRSWRPISTLFFKKPNGSENIRGFDVVNQFISEWSADNFDFVSAPPPEAIDYSTSEARVRGVQPFVMHLTSDEKDVSSFGKAIGIILSRFKEVISNGTFEDKDEAYGFKTEGDPLMEEFYINRRGRGLRPTSFREHSRKKSTRRVKNTRRKRKNKKKVKTDIERSRKQLEEDLWSFLNNRSRIN